MLTTILLVVIFVLLVANIVLARRFKTFLGEYNNVEAFLERERSRRLQELNRHNDLQKEKLYAQMEKEREELKLEVDERRRVLQEEVDKHRQIEQEKLDKLREVTRLELEKIQKNYELKSQSVEEDKLIIQRVLDDLKEKQERTIEVMKEQEKEEDEIEFHRISLSSDERQDIELLKEVEKRLHNKDILRKLIYKSYIEKPMNEMFARIGVETEPGIYKIENVNDKRTYIGQSTNVRNRLREHVKAAIGISSIANQAVHEAMAEEGIENFLFTIVDPCGRGNLNDREKYWIDFYKSNEWGYNRTRGGS